MDRAELAEHWAAALTKVVAVPRTRERVAAELRDLLDAAVACLAGPAPAHRIGHRLVELGYDRPECVQVCVDVLASGLPGLAEVDDPALAAAVLVDLAAGVAEATARRQFGDPTEQAAADTGRASDAWLRRFFADSAWGMAISGVDGVIVRANRAMEEMLGHRVGSLTGTRLEDLFHPQERDYLNDRYAELARGQAERFDEHTRFVRADAETAWVRLEVSFGTREGRPGHLTMLADNSDLHLLEDRLSHQGTHDRLTGLPNRQAFVGRLEAALGAGRDVSVFHLGLDDFAVVNDGVGRAAGDHLLREVARRLAESVEDRDGIVARLSGDEFGVLVEHGPHGLDVGTLAAEFNAVLAEPTYVDGEGIAATATIAVVDLPTADSDPNELLRATDIAMRTRKHQGRRQWTLVDPEQNERYREHYRLAAGVPGAWENGELDVDLWPVVSLADGARVATQALLRWEHPKHGTLDHVRCAEIMRHTGLGVPVGHWVLEHAAELAAREGSALYLELTPEQAADPDLIAAVHRVLRATGLEGEHLELGMPVQALDSPDSPAADNLGVLVDLGVRSVLTGFGRGRGDLACLEDLQINTVRVSEHVVARLANPDPTSLYARATLGLIPLVREVGISVLVTGLTTETQARWWRDAGADLGSGPLY
ncbi:EAL domain-containing protein [Actinokineospora enzanensis]|uniref:EAL domain-containing protein n=1 Tax=Actinokineospora enzanensis TaxID=155975 RepID=UPI0012EC49CB|nr:EAL domain-containing protein [Actinokineospora enzanensis]